MPERLNGDDPETFTRKIARKEQRKLRSRRRGRLGAWFGLGMFGLVGWAVVVPLLIGLGLGHWIDRTWPSSYSWTLMLMIFGLFVGVLNAWQWVDREHGMIERETETEDDDG